MMMKQIKEILKICRKADKFLITSHHNPDADAAASVLAMAIFLKSLGKKVVMVNEDALPDWLKFLPQSALFKKAAQVKPFQYDAAIVLDCGDLKRIGGVQKLLLEGKPLINIDHHRTNEGFGDVSLVSSKASSTCEIVFEILKAGRCRLNKSLATVIYAGIMTDTGSFRFENTQARTHAIAAELMSFGLNAAELYQKLYVGIPVKDMKLFIDLIHKAHLLLNNKVYCVLLPQKTVQAFSKSFDLKERLFGFLRSVDGIEVVVILTELNSKETRVNLRSQSRFDVAKLAQQFNGGGHIKAAGATIYDNLANAQKKMLAAIAKQI
jgi:phosphoesterase RecJ-like protein